MLSEVLSELTVIKSRLWHHLPRHHEMQNGDGRGDQTP